METGKRIPSDDGSIQQISCALQILLIIVGGFAVL